MPSYFPPSSALSVWKRGRGLQAPALQHATELLLPARRAQLLVLGYAAVTTQYLCLKEALHSARCAPWGRTAAGGPSKPSCLKLKRRRVCLTYHTQEASQQTEWGRTPGRAQAPLPLLAQAMRLGHRARPDLRSQVWAQDPLWLAAADNAIL